ncbi:MAG: preprotein translocase subunit SecG [Acidobacteriota bacterium]
MEGLLLFIHIVVSLLLIIIVLLQSGKSADLAGAFGGGGTQSAFGPRGAATILSKATTFLAVAFMITSLLLYIVATNNVNADTVLDKSDTKQEEKLPAADTKNDEKKVSDPVEKKGTEDNIKDKATDNKENN